jgi:hypothetical protein
MPLLGAADGNAERRRAIDLPPDPHENATAGHEIKAQSGPLQGNPNVPLQSRARMASKSSVSSAEAKAGQG